MESIENQIFKVLKEIDNMIKNNEKENIETKMKELDNLLKIYLKDFK